MHCSKLGIRNRCHLLVGVISRYKKGVPFLSKMVYKRVRGRTSLYKALVTDAYLAWYAGNYTLKVVLVKKAFLKYEGVRPRETPS